MQGFFEKSLIWPPPPRGEGFGGDWKTQRNGPPRGSGPTDWSVPLPPHPSGLQPATFPHQGGRLIGATIETTVQWGKFQRWSLPSHRGSELWDPTPWAGHFPQTSAYLQKPSPSRGKVAPPQAVTDEGETKGLLHHTNEKEHSVNSQITQGIISSAL